MFVYDYSNRGVLLLLLAVIMSVNMNLSYTIITINQNGRKQLKFVLIAHSLMHC